MTQSEYDTMFKKVNESLGKIVLTKDGDTWGMLQFLVETHDKVNRLNPSNINQKWSKTMNEGARWWSEKESSTMKTKKKTSATPEEIALEETREEHADLLKKVGKANDRFSKLEASISTAQEALSVIQKKHKAEELRQKEAIAVHQTRIDELAQLRERMETRFDFVLPKAFTENVFDASPYVTADSSHSYEIGVEVHTEKTGWFKSKIKSIRHKFESIHVNTRTEALAHPSYQEVLAYVAAIKKYVVENSEQGKVNAPDYDKWIDEGNEIVIGNDPHAKDAFILKMLEFFKNSSKTI